MIEKWENVIMKQSLNLTLVFSILVKRWAYFKSIECNFTALHNDIVHFVVGMSLLRPLIVILDAKTHQMFYVNRNCIAYQ